MTESTQSIGGTDDDSSANSPDDRPEQTVADRTKVQDTGSGMNFDRYRVDTTLGEGAMGKVFRGEHVLMEKTVAIKVLHAEMLDNEEMVARFHREARAAAALDHPHVCQATDFGRADDGSFFLVMEYLEGKTLQQLLETDERLAPSRALEIGAQIAGALAEAHRQGIVHRDLKPENVMLVDGDDGDGDHVKIMDFGIARLVADGDEDTDAQTRLTRQGMVYGTPHYMSPEQVAGDDVDAATDLYALGVLLFEMVAGHPPFDGANIARVMGKHVTEPVPDLQAHRPELSDEFVDLVEQLLAKDSGARPDGADVVSERIDAIDSPTRHAPPARDAATTAEAAAQPRRGSEKLTDGWKQLPKTERHILAVTGMGLAGLVALLFFAGFVMVAVSVFGGDEDHGEQLEAAEQTAEQLEDAHGELLEDDRIAAAVERAEEGERDELDELLDERGDDPHLRFLALQADYRADRSVDVVAEADEILQRDDRYAEQPQLAKWLVDEIDDDDAQSLIADHLSATLRDELANQASVGTPTSLRDAAYEFLEDQRQLQQLERWQQVTVEMRQTTGCEPLREKIEELVEIGDPRAVPTLEVYDETPETGCGALNMQDCLGCIRSDLSDALDALGDD